MTKEEMIKRIERGCHAEDLFPGVLGNPVIYAARWGLPLSKSYLAHLEARRQAKRPRNASNGKPTRVRPRKPMG
jgi:hypothetical protein